MKGYIASLATDPKLREEGEALKASILADPVFLRQTELLWEKLEASLLSDIAHRSDDVAQVNDQTISDLMDIWLLAQEFLKAYVTQFTLLETEGNVLAPAANGTSAGAALTAGSAA